MLSHLKPSEASKRQSKINKMLIFLILTTKIMSQLNKIKRLG